MCVESSLIPTPLAPIQFKSEGQFVPEDLSCPVPCVSLPWSACSFGPFVVKPLLLHTQGRGASTIFMLEEDV